MTIEEELVTKSRKVSTGRLRERWLESDKRKVTRVWRHAAGNEFSAGSTGVYHHLDMVSHCARKVRMCPGILDIVADDGICKDGQGSRRVWPES